MKMRTELVIGLVSGTIIGSAVGFALAPRSGKETRDGLGYQFGKIKERVITKARDRGQNTVGAGESRADYLH